MQREGFYGYLFFVGDNKTYSCTLPDFNQTWTDFRESPHYQFSRQSVQSEPRWCIFGQTETRKTRDKAHNLFSWLFQSSSKCNPSISNALESEFFTAM